MLIVEAVLAFDIELCRVIPLFDDDDDVEDDSECGDRLPLMKLLTLVVNVVLVRCRDGAVGVVVVVVDGGEVNTVGLFDFLAKLSNF